MRPRTLRLTVIPSRLAVCRLEPEAAELETAVGSKFHSITRTGEEVSVVCDESAVPAGARAEKGWRALKVRGPIPFAETGVLASLALPLADAEIGIFVISTYDTDYLLVKGADLDRAVAALAAAGHEVEM